MSTIAVSELMLSAQSTLNASYAPSAGLQSFDDASGKPMTITSASGCNAAAYQDASGNVIIAFQGTTSQAQLQADVQIVAGQATAKVFSDALSFAKAVQAQAAADGLTSVSVTGHSLGGTLAEYVAMKTGLPGASFAGSGLPGYASAASRPTNFDSFVETGDPWANFGSDTAGRALFGRADHYGTLNVVGSPSAAASVATVVHDVQALLPAMFFGHGQQAAQTLVGDWNNAMARYHPMDVYAADIAKAPSMTMIPTS